MNQSPASSPAMMRSARLHGIGDLRLDSVPVPTPEPGELLVAIEANGVCATDARKFRVGVNDGEYPFNPGHEWVGRVAGLGEGVVGWSIGDRIYGDTYGGYAEFTTIRVDPEPWSAGPHRVPDHVALDRAVFVEPLADCIHAVFDQAALTEGSTLVVVAAGSMGLMTIAVAARAGIRVLAVEPQPARRALALEFGASDALEPDGWVAEARRLSPGGANAVILCNGNPDLVAGCIEATANGGRVVLFAGFGDRPVVSVDLNALHYREVALVGSEWIGTPPNQRRDRYDDAMHHILYSDLPLERLVSERCSFDDLEAAFVGRSAGEVLKSVFTPEVVR